MEFTGSQLFSIIGELYAELHITRQQLIQAHQRIAEELETKKSPSGRPRKPKNAATIQNPPDRAVQHPDQ
jgi:hypothetical protein